MKKLSRNEMKNVTGGLREPGNGASGCGSTCSGACKCGVHDGSCGSNTHTTSGCACYCVY